MWARNRSFAEVVGTTIQDTIPASPSLNPSLESATSPQFNFMITTLSPPSSPLDSSETVQLTPVRISQTAVPPKTAPVHQRQHLSHNHATATITGHHQPSILFPSSTTSTPTAPISSSAHSDTNRQLLLSKIPPPSARRSRRSDPAIHFDQDGHSVASTAARPPATTPRQQQKDVDMSPITATRATSKSLTSFETSSDFDSFELNTPSKQITMLKRINRVRSRFPVSTPTTRSMRHKVLSTSGDREEVQETLARYERRIALEDRANVVRALLIQAARERVIDPEAVAILH